MSYEERNRAIAEARASGASYVALAKSTGLSRSRVRRITIEQRLADAEQALRSIRQVADEALRGEEQVA